MLKFSKWLDETSRTFPVSLTDIVNFLCTVTKKDGDYISYGSLRLYKATIYNTTTLTGTLLPPSDAEEAQLQALIDTVKRTSPDKARHDTTFDLDDLLTHLLEDDEVKSHVATRNNFACKDERARARGRAIVTRKLQSYRGLDFSRDFS